MYFSIQDGKLLSAGACQGEHVRSFQSLAAALINDLTYFCRKQPPHPLLVLGTLRSYGGVLEDAAPYNTSQSTVL